MTSNNESVARAVGLRKTYGERVAVDDVNFEIAAGETFGLLGPNGAGKSTTISVIVGLLQADEGTVTVAGTPITPRSTKGKAAIGYVPQEIAVYPDLTAEENLRFFARLQGVPKADIDVRVAEVLKLIGLNDRWSERTSTFSGGMNRRLNIGIGLLHRPRLLVLDEPTVGVDPQSRNAILESVEALAGEGLAVLYTTHYMEEAERLCDRVGIIDEGRLLVVGRHHELVAVVGEQERITIGMSRSDGTVDELRRRTGVSDVTVSPGGVEVLVDDASRRLSGIVDAISAGGGEIDSVEVERPDLEAVFLHLTGKGLRD